ncbi:MAG TPA: hypothetical protein PLQ93_11385 [Bacteroidia bacterium]|nr:hypothetical protein [Bacteroidia bacterium]
MKRLYTLLLIFSLLAVKAQTQETQTQPLKSPSPVQITLLTFESYSFADKIVTEDGYDGKINDGFQWGGGFEFCFKERMALELIYQRLSTDAYLDRPLASISGSNIINTVDRTQGKIGIDYYLLGGTRYQPFTDKVSGFSTINAGLGVLSTLDNSKDSNVEKFCWGLRLGLKIKANDKVSIRLHGQLLSAVQALGGGLYLGTGGTGAGLTGYSTFWQFNLGGSINFLLKG